MSKPLGIGIGISDGIPVFRMTPIDRVADKVWDAVEEAVCAGWTAQRFIQEARQAWAHELKEHAKIADEAFKCD